MVFRFAGALALLLVACDGTITLPIDPLVPAEPQLPTGNSIQQKCVDPNLIPQTVRLSRLTHVQYRNVVLDALGVTAQTDSFTPDAASGGFTNNAAQLQVTETLVKDWNRSAEDMAAQIVGTAALLNQVAPCSGGQTQACFNAFVASAGQKLYRKPLTASQLSKLQTAWTAAGPLYATGTQFQKAVQMALEAMLQSVSFLYRVEHSTATGSNGAVALSSDELAEKLALSLWASAPDAALFAAASQRQLETPAGVATQALRMLGDARARAVMRDFYNQWLGLAAYDNISKNGTVYPTWSASGVTGADLREEQQRFFEDLTFDSNGTFKDIFTAGYTFMNGPIAALYKQSGISGATFQRVTLDMTQRKGLLTQPGFLAANAYNDSDSPIHRGAFVLKKLMGATFTPPPGIDFTLPPLSATLKTTRERIAEKTKAEGCQVCHGAINPVGFSFEHYDGIGQWRDQDNSVTVDTSGSLPTPEAMVDPTKWKMFTPIAVTDALELQDKLAEHETLQACFIAMWLRYLEQRLDGAEDACAVQEIRGKLCTQGYTLKNVIADIVSSRAFLNRAEETMQ